MKKKYQFSKICPRCRVLNVLIDFQVGDSISDAKRVANSITLDASPCVQCGFLFSAQGNEIVLWTGKGPKPACGFHLGLVCPECGVVSMMPCGEDDLQKIREMEKTHSMTWTCIECGRKQTRNSKDSTYIRFEKRQ